MNEKELIQRIQNISIWKKGDQRAPHKPLLILYALGQLRAGKPRYITYKEVKEKLTTLLIEFGPKRRSYHPEEPFVRLTNDGIWELTKKEIIDKRNPNNKFLLDNQVCGGFNEQTYKLLHDNNNLIKEVAEIFYLIIFQKPFMKTFSPLLV